MDRLPCVVIGAGVVGLAVARALAWTGRDVTILEAEAHFGMHTSSRNSEVIHAGIYYAPGSLKARLCVAGRERLYAYCQERGIAHKRIGKIVVAASEQDVAAVRGYLQRARQNGVTDLQWLDGAELRELEPAVRSVGGFLSPSTGIIDSHALMLALLGDAEARGARLVTRAPVLGGRVLDSGIELRIGGAEEVTIKADEVVNCAGLGAQAVACSIQGIPRQAIPPVYYLRGHYFELAGASPFRRLVYPKAGGGGLGVHVTLDLSGRARFGPDSTEWTDHVDYAFNEGLRDSFVAAIRAYFPAIDAHALRPAYVGVRPKLVQKGMPDADFMVCGPQSHGVQGLVALYGIESPGLTSALALADAIAPALGSR